MKRLFILLATCGMALSAQAGCYSIYNRAGQLVYRSTDAPVDTQPQYHRTVPQRFGQGASLVYFNDFEGCGAYGSLIQLSGTEVNQGAQTSRSSQARPARADRS
ncbi:MAG: hypothetical protein JWR60_1827 [Polaromonas sp.]|nr:hypothetical protein [Polaromonas sp.]